MENGTQEQSSADHQGRKRSLGAVLLVLLTVVLSIGLTVAWFTLIGYGAWRCSNGWRDKPAGAPLGDHATASALSSAKAKCGRSSL